MGESSKDPALADFRRFLYIGDSTKIYPMSTFYPFNREDIQHLFQLPESESDAVCEIIRAYREEHYLNIDTLLYALAKFAHSSNFVVKEAALKAAADLCLSSTSLLTFTYFYKELSMPTKGWSRSQRKFFSKWYNGRDAKDLAVEITKVKSHKKWSHKDVLCMTHVKAEDVGTAAVLKFIVKGYEASEKEFSSDSEAEPVLRYLKGFHELNHSTDIESAARQIEIHDLCLEHVPTKLLKTKEVSLCLIPRVPIKKLLTLIPLFCKVGFLKLNSSHYKALLERLNSEETLSDSSIGPIETFYAIRKWQLSNRIFPGKTLVRQNTPAIDDALQNLHLSSFKSVISTQKRYLIAVDIRPTMSHSVCAGCRIVTPSSVSDIILLALVKAELSNVTVLVFSNEEMVCVDINNKMTISDVNEHMSKVASGPVNLVGPLEWALTKKKPYDLFLLFSDCSAGIGTEGIKESFKEYKDTLHLPNTRYLICSLCDRVATTYEGIPSIFNTVGFNIQLLKIIQDYACGIF